jgi:isopenicillin-N epimerase
MSWTPGSSSLTTAWALDPTVTFLNHGSFGAAPRPVLAAQSAWRDEMEREPVDFLARRLPVLMEGARARIAAWLGADPAGLVPVSNATTGVSTVLQSLAWSPGDEVLVADCSYNAVLQAVRALGDRWGVRMVHAKVPFPITSGDEAVAAYAAAYTPRTRLVIVDHVVSPTALVLPVERIVADARARGVPVLVDGAHGPGMLPLALDALGADFYTGNLHKWVCAPKGAAFLHCGPAWRTRVHPLAISHGYGAGLSAEFDWIGTVDPTAWLAVPAALDFFETLGWTAVRAANHALVREGRVLVANALGVPLPHPDDAALYGSMAAIPVPWAGPATPGRLAGLTAALFDSHRIEVPFTAYDARVWVRISAQLYNSPEQYVSLAEVLRTWRG